MVIKIKTEHTRKKNSRNNKTETTPGFTCSDSNLESYITAGVFPLDQSTFQYEITPSILTEFYKRLQNT